MKGGLHFTVFIAYLFLLAGVAFLLHKRKKAFNKHLSCWIYALALPASYLTGWAFLGMPASLISNDLSFIAFYLGIGLFSFIFPFFLEKAYAVFERYKVNDVVSFVMIRYSKNPKLKKLLIVLITTVTIPYIAINIKSLELLFQIETSSWAYIFIALAMLFIFVYFIREWKGITLVAIQGVVMIVALALTAGFVMFFVFDGPSELFGSIQNTLLESKLRVREFSSLLNSWNINMVVSAFAFLFLPRQFSILSQGLHLNKKERIFKTSLVSIIFFLVLMIYVVSVGSGVLSLNLSTLSTPQLSENSLFHFISQRGNILIYILFILGGFSFVLSTLNQQLIAFSDILKKHLNFKVAISLAVSLLTAFFLSIFMKNIYIHKVGGLCLLGIFLLTIPVFGGMVWEKAHYKGANAAMLTGLSVWFVLGWGGFFANPKNFVNGEPWFGHEFFSKLYSYLSPFSGGTVNALHLTFFYMLLLGTIAFVFCSLRSDSENYEEKEFVYLPGSPSTSNSEDFAKMFQFFNYDLDAIRICALLFNNRELSFLQGEIREYLPVEFLDRKLIFLQKEGLILKEKSRGDSFYRINSEYGNQKELSHFLDSFFSFEKVLENITHQMERSQRVVKTRLDQLENLYKIYLKIGALRTKKDFFATIAKVLPMFYPDIIRIDYIKKQKVRTLFSFPKAARDSFDFKINLGAAYLNITISDKLDMNNLFVIEPIITLTYRLVDYIEKLKRYTIKLKNVDTYRNHFISNISHELRTPMVPLKGYLSILRELPGLQKDPEVMDMLLSMQGSYKRLEDLIENLILFKDISFDLFKVEKVNLLELFFSTIMGVQSKLKEKQIELHFKENDFQEVEIEGDREKLNLAFLHLLDNAIKFNRSGGKIFIRLKKRDNDFIILIKDTGIGISPDTIGHVFEEFYQADSEATRSYEGSGIGLSLVKKIIALHGGKVQIRSEKSQNTRVYVRLPKRVMGVGPKND